MSSDDAHARNRVQYGAVADRYATSASHAGGDDLIWFTARAASVAPARALDVACGGGFSTRALRAAGHRVVATDLTPESLHAARKALGDPTVSWVAGAAERLPLRSASVDVVGCRIAPHHFADIARFVDEVARVLTAQGMFLLVDTTVPEDEALAKWVNDVERLRDPSHGQAWPPSRWQVVLGGAGLRIVETRTFRKRHSMEAWLGRAACTGAAAAEVRARFRAAPEAARAAYGIESDDAGEVIAYTDTKLCLRATCG